MQKLNVVILIIILMIAGSYRVSAVTIIVPDESDTIQAAIDMAESGDEIVVRDGVYHGEGFRDIRFLGKEITVRSENGKDNCTIKGLGDHEDYRAFIFDQNETSKSVLTGFNIIYFWADIGNATWGGAVIILLA